MDSVDASSISRALKKIEKDLSEIKEHMVDIDSILTEDDYLALTEYRSDKAKGRLVLHEDLKKELGL
jgi:hypothetical protein